MKDYKNLFPFYSKHKNSVYLDTACMGLKPYKVADSIKEYYEDYSICAGRAPYSISKELTDRLELSREKIASLINARSRREIIFTRNTSESINLLANIFPFKSGDRVIITDKEHNSNHCVWKELEKKGVIRLSILDVNDDNTFPLGEFSDLISKGDTALVSTVHISNLDGIVNPIEKIIELSHKFGAKVLIDAAQSVPHTRLDSQKTNADFIAFSIHKIYGPTGMGVLYVRNEHFKNLSLYNVGGDTIRNTYVKKDTEYRSYPYTYEAGLQDFAGMLASGAAVDFVNEIGYDEMEQRIDALNNDFRKFIKEFEEVSVIGDTDLSLVKGITTFFIKKFTRMSENDVTIGEKLDNKFNILVRTGFFCVNPYFDNRERKGLINPIHYPAIRISFGFYNDDEDLDKLKFAVRQILEELKELPII